MTENINPVPEKKKVIKDANIDTKLLYAKLASMQPGEEISYSALSTIIGRDVQREARSYMDSARRMAEREDGKLFGVIKNEGLKCLKDIEIVYTGTSAIEHIRRHSRRAARKFQCIKDMSSLRNEDIVRLNTDASILGVMAYMGKSKNIKKIEHMVESVKEQLPYAKTLDAFR